MTQILLIEDNRDYGQNLASNLRRDGYEVTIAADGADGLNRARTGRPDLIILDLMLPSMGGFTVLQRLRDEGRAAPVLIMSALGTEEEKLRGFSLGADDYIVKPVGLREIQARVRALLRRATAADTPNQFMLGEITVDFTRRAVRRGDKPLSLRPKEFDLLAALIRHRPRIVTRDELLRDVWSYAPTAQSRTVETHVAALRAALGDSASRPRYVLTVRSAGYRLGDG
jgi:DNA-binding response OmpR family regulator